MFNMSINGRELNLDRIIQTYSNPRGYHASLLSFRHNFRIFLTKTDGENQSFKESVF